MLYQVSLICPKIGVEGFFSTFVSRNRSSLFSEYCLMFYPFIWSMWICQFSHLKHCKGVLPSPQITVFSTFVDAVKNRGRKLLVSRLLTGSWVLWTSCWWKKMTDCRSKCLNLCMRMATWNNKSILWVGLLWLIKLN